ncbi:MAG: DnaJ domain-containing protein [Clostridia bacterium]|nr:DnaJ domain-containing protein [Clostridia bacterium]
MNATEAFKVLGIEKKFPISEETVKKHYREKAKENHPDITGNDEQMKVINAAYEWLNLNLDKVNNANTQNKEKQKFKSTDDMVKTFASLYLIEQDINKRKRMIDDLLKMLENYKLEEKLSMFRDILNKK